MKLVLNMFIFILISIWAKGFPGFGFVRFSRALRFIAQNNHNKNHPKSETRVHCLSLYLYWLKYLYDFFFEL